MNRRIPRLFGALLFASTLAIGSVPAAVLARVPVGWGTSTLSTPPVVTNGQPSGIVVTFSNAGPSNVSQLYLVATTPNGATFVQATPTQGFCNAAAPLFCNLGAVNAGSHVDVTVVFTTPGSGTSMPAPFEFNTTGVAADKKNRSHGDAIPAAATVGLSPTSNRDYFGRFAYNNTLLTIFDDQTLSNKNQQSTKANGPKSGISPAVGEMSLGTFTCPTDPARTRPCFSEWSTLDVGGGTGFADTGFSAVVTLGHWELPNGIDAENIGFVHVLDNDNVEVLDRCTTDTPPVSEMPCFTAVDSGNDVIATFWLTENGKINGW